MSAAADQAKHPAAGPNVSAYPLDDDLVVYDADTRQGFILNGTAAQIWELSDGSRTPTELAEEVARAYGVEYAQALADVEELLVELEGAGLLAGSK